jgi:hypothetical protein
MFDLGLDDLLDEQEMFGSPPHKSNVSSSFDWSDGVNQSTTKMDDSAQSAPTVKVQMTGFHLPEVVGVFENRSLAPPFPLPMIGIRKRISKQFSFHPSAFRPFTSLESTELSVEQLRSVLRRNERRTDPVGKKSTHEEVL